MKVFTSTTTAKPYSNYSGEQCEIVERCDKDKVDIDEVGNMYVVRFADGQSLTVFEDELTEATK